MQTASSANRTWSASRSASEWTATVLIPNSRQAQMMRQAISPRFAIRIFLNIVNPSSARHRPSTASPKRNGTLSFLVSRV